MSPPEVVIEPPKIDETVVRVRKLHSEVIAAARTTIVKAIEIGEILTSKKKELGHGNWLPWARLLPFSYKTAERYMNLAQRRDKLDNVSNLSEAYRLLSSSSDAERLASLEDQVRARLSEFLACGAALDEMNQVAPDRLQKFLGDRYNLTMEGLKIYWLIVSEDQPNAGAIV